MFKTICLNDVLDVNIDSVDEDLDEMYKMYVELGHVKSGDSNNNKRKNSEEDLDQPAKRFKK